MYEELMIMCVAGRRLRRKRKKVCGLAT